MKILVIVSYFLSSFVWAQTKFAPPTRAEVLTPFKSPVGPKPPVTNPTFKAFEEAMKSANKLPPQTVKSEGGVQDGGGGSESEAELTHMIYDWSLQIWTPDLKLRQLKLLDGAAFSKFKELFPQKSKQIKVCVYISREDVENPCADRTPQIVIGSQEWDHLDKSSKKFQALQKLLQVVGVSDQASSVERASEFYQILSSSGSHVDRYDIVSRLQDGRFIAIRNKNPDHKDYISLSRKGREEMQFIIQRMDTPASSARPAYYRIDPNEGYFNVDICRHEESPDDSLQELMQDEYVYNEFKPLVEACARMLSQGQQPVTIFVQRNLGLTLNCF